jgi:hypothetical protein
MKVIDFTTAVTAKERAARFASARRVFRKMFKRWADEQQALRRDPDDLRR